MCIDNDKNKNIEFNIGICVCVFFFVFFDLYKVNCVRNLHRDYIHKMNGTSMSFQCESALLIVLSQTVVH